MKLNVALSAIAAAVAVVSTAAVAQTAAPASRAEVKAETKAAALNIDQKPLSVSIDDKGAIFLADQPVAIEALTDRLKALAKDGYDERIYVRGAKAVNYGRVAEVMSIVTSAGYKKVALVTDQEKK